MEVKNRSLEFSLEAFSDNPFLLSNLKERVRKGVKLAAGLAAVFVPTYMAINAVASYLISNSLVNIFYDNIQGVQ